MTINIKDTIKVRRHTSGLNVKSLSDYIAGNLALFDENADRWCEWAKHGITDYQFNPDFPVNTLQIMRGATAAKIDGFFADYVDAVFHHMWEAPKKMDDPDVITAALTDSGLDATHIAKRIQDADVKQQLIRATEDAVERGVFGSPTFFVGSEIFFGKDKLRDVEEEIENQRA